VPGGRWIDAAEAAERLGVKPATLYAYVSRGVLTRRREQGGRSRFDIAEVEQLARRGRPRRAVSPSELVIESQLTELLDGRPFYRGLDALELAATAPFEEVAEWLWTGEKPPGARQHPSAVDDAAANREQPGPRRDRNAVDDAAANGEQPGPRQDRNAVDDAGGGTEPPAPRQHHDTVDEARGRAKPPAPRQDPDAVEDAAGGAEGARSTGAVRSTGSVGASGPGPSWHVPDAAVAAGRAAQSGLPAGVLPLERLQVVTCALAAVDPAAARARPARCGGRRTHAHHRPCRVPARTDPRLDDR